MTNNLPQFTRETAAGDKGPIGQKNERMK